MKKIVFSINPSSISFAIRNVEKFKIEFKNKINKFIGELLNQGVEIAKIQIASLGAFDSGNLSGSIKTIMYAEENKGVIFTDCPYAAFVEFGTGIVGSNNPHPTMPWQYDINGHGEKGWVYFDEKENKFRWTKGISSRPFMYYTMQELADEAENISRMVFK